MTQNPNPAPQKLGTPSIVLLTPKETAARLKVSTSWLAKARIRADGPPYIRIGRSIRYSEFALIQWTKSLAEGFDQRGVAGQRPDSSRSYGRRLPTVFSSSRPES